MKTKYKTITVCILLFMLLSGCRSGSAPNAIVSHSQSSQSSQNSQRQTAGIKWSEEGEPLLAFENDLSYAFDNLISSPCMSANDALPICCVRNAASFHYIIPKYSEGQCSVTYFRIDEGASAWESSVLTLEDQLLADGGNTYILSFWSTDDGTLLVTNSGGYTACYKTNDSGRTWSISPSIGWHAPHVTGGGFLSADFGIVCYQHHGESPADLLYTRDGGTTWSPLLLQIPGMSSSDYAEGGTPFWRDGEIVLPLTIYRNTEQGLFTTVLEFSSSDVGLTWDANNSDPSEFIWTQMQ